MQKTSRIKHVILIKIDQRACLFMQYKERSNSTETRKYIIMFLNIIFTDTAKLIRKINFMYILYDIFEIYSVNVNSLESL